MVMKVGGLVNARIKSKVIPGLLELTRVFFVPAVAVLRSLLGL